jgi:hypothetical protein
VKRLGRQASWPVLRVVNAADRSMPLSRIDRHFNDPDPSAIRL